MTTGHRALCLAIDDPVECLEKSLPPFLLVPMLAFFNRRRNDRNPQVRNPHPKTPTRHSGTRFARISAFQSRLPAPAFVSKSQGKAQKHKFLLPYSVRLHWLSPYPTNLN